MCTTTLTLPSIRCVQKSKKIKKPWSTWWSKTASFQDVEKKTSVGKTANMWFSVKKRDLLQFLLQLIGHAPNVIHCSHTAPKALGYLRWSMMIRWKTQEDSGIPRVSTNQLSPFSGTYLHKLGGITYSASLGQFPYIYLYYICKPHRDHWHKESQVTTFLPLTQSKRCCGHKHGISLGKDIINGSDLFPFLGSNVQFF